MSLQDITPELTFESITSDRLTGTITDDTTFGGSNPARNVLAVYLSGSKMKYNSTIDYALTITPNAGPATVSSWTFSIAEDKDGWNRFLYTALPLYSGGTTYSQYDAVYQASTYLTYRSLQSSNTGNALSNTSFWEPITDASQLALNSGETNQSNNIASTVYSILVSANSEYAMSSQIAITSQEGGDTKSGANMRLSYLLGVLVNGLYIHGDRAEYPQGETLARRIETIATEAALL